MTWTITGFLLYTVITDIKKKDIPFEYKGRLCKLNTQQCVTHSSDKCLTFRLTISKMCNMHRTFMQ